MTLFDALPAPGRAMDFRPDFPPYTWAGRVEVLDVRGDETLALWPCGRRAFIATEELHPLHEADAPRRAAA